MKKFIEVEVTVRHHDKSKILIATDGIISIQEKTDGGCMIHLGGDTYHHIDKPYEEIKQQVFQLIQDK